MQDCRKIFFLFVRLYTVFWEQICGRNIGTVIKEPVSKYSGPNRKETLFTFRGALKEALIPLFWQPELLMTLTFVFPFYAYYLNINRIYFLLSRKHRIQREVLERGKKGNCISDFVKSFPLPFLSHKPSEQTSFLQYSLLKKESFVFSFLTSLQPFA